MISRRDFQNSLHNLRAREAVRAGQLASPYSDTIESYVNQLEEKVKDLEETLDVMNDQGREASEYDD